MESLNIWYPSCNPLWRTEEQNRVAFLSQRDTFATIRTDQPYSDADGRVTVEFRSPAKNFDHCILCIIPSSFTSFDKAVDGAAGSGVRYDWDGDLYSSNDGKSRSVEPFGAGRISIVKLVLDFPARVFEWILDEKSQGRYSMDTAGLRGALYPAFCSMFDAKLHITAPWPASKPMPLRVVPTTDQLNALRGQLTTLKAKHEGTAREIQEDIDRQTREIEEVKKKIAQSTTELESLKVSWEEARESLKSLNEQVAKQQTSTDELAGEVTRLRKVAETKTAAAAAAAIEEPEETVDETKAVVSADISGSLKDVMQFKGGLLASMKELDRNDLNDSSWADAEKLFRSGLNNKIDDYVGDRIRENKQPIAWHVTKIAKVTNSVLEYRYQHMKASLNMEDAVAQLEFEQKKRDTRPEPTSKEQYGFHGCNPMAITPICTNGLLRVGHPLNPSKSTDDGWFGIPQMGVYLSRYADYTFKYANGLAPLDIGESCQVIMFKILPGKSRHIPEVTPGLKPTDPESQGYHSHSSPNFSEWYLFNEAQCCPTHVFTVRAIADTRTKSDDS